MRKSTIAKIAVTVALLGGVFAYLLTSGASDSMIYYKTIDEVLAERARFEREPVRLNGLLVAGSIKQRPGTDEYRFTLDKAGRTIEVQYEGILPDSMEPGRELVVQGRLASGADRFEASEILTKCPSKYEDIAKAKGGM